MTEWRLVPDWDEYLVSDEGNVFYIMRNRMLVLSSSDKVTLYKNKVQKRPINPGNLVLEAFVGPCPVGMECRHIDDNRRNNNINNLCWGTREENMADRKRNGLIPNTGHLRGENANHVIMTEIQVLEAIELRKVAPSVWSYSKLGRRYGVTKGAVMRAVKGKTWKHLKREGV